MFISGVQLWSCPRVSQHPQQTFWFPQPTFPSPFDPHSEASGISSRPGKLSQCQVLQLEKCAKPYLSPFWNKLIRKYLAKISDNVLKDNNIVSTPIVDQFVLRNNELCKKTKFEEIWASWKLISLAFWWFGHINLEFCMISMWVTKIVISLPYCFDWLGNNVLYHKMLYKSYW